MNSIGKLSNFKIRTCSDSLRAVSSSSSMQVSTTSRNMGGIGGTRVIVYSIVENAGISSAG